MDAKKYLLANGIQVDMEVFAPGLAEEGKDRIELSVLLDMYAEQRCEQQKEICYEALTKRKRYQPERSAILNAKLATDK